MPKLFSLMLTNKNQWMTRILYVAVLQLALLPLAHAQESTDAVESTIAIDDVQSNDTKIRDRIANIYAEMESLAEVEVLVKEGVVTLKGETVNDTQANNALSLAKRIQGVVTVEDEIERTLDLRGNVAPLIQSTSKSITKSIRGLPLILLAVGVFVLIVFVGNKLAKLQKLWRKVVPNPFLAELLGSAIRFASVIFALVTSLNILGANTLIGTILGGAGVMGIAIGFAVRDTLENYISSIMLSLRQPFRANDHVVIDNHEGVVVRLTSRATVLMTLEGNHLRIPNSQVFKAVILNYTRNPERRFEFVLGVDAEDDPIKAIKSCVDAVSALKFILSEPKPAAIIDSVGDSNIAIRVQAWVNQNETDYNKGRSLAIREAKVALEQQGFTLPEPIYRLRFDAPILGAASQGATTGSTAGGMQEIVVKEVPTESQDDNQSSNATSGNTAAANNAAKANMEKPQLLSEGNEEIDVAPDRHVESIAEAERAEQKENNETDLLDSSKPVE